MGQLLDTTTMCACEADTTTLCACEAELRDVESVTRRCSSMGTKEHRGASPQHRAHPHSSRGASV
eukprot:gene11481-biopygen1132